MITDDDIAFGYSLILSDFISFDLWLDWRCEVAKRELHQRIDQRRSLDSIEQEIKRLKVKIEDHLQSGEAIKSLFNKVEIANYLHQSYENRLRTRLHN